MDTADDRELTPWERELQQADACEGRGHVPDDGVAEPSAAPADPASASARAAREPLPAPADTGEAPDDE
ncbi:hypothetical protein CP973_17000 [Streptomyces albofaciens JCM 4342]|uniref:hypothetical protein n=1 Tax=Streptomyces albofaciens TaxID=66866 RepID=UPI0012391A5A|nr:hypothetical protein [Streptomyces albofaciens]KAA6223392.1 hypothetical protein CP973_17000 [Streptomyces albofaciens JCM 4342]